MMSNRLRDETTGFSLLGGRREDEVETKRYHKVRTFLNIKRKVHHTAPNSPCWKIERRALKTSKVLQVENIELMAIFWGVFSLTLNDALEACPLSSTQGELFRHWDSGQVFFTHFQNQVAWKESEAKKPQKIWIIKGLAYLIKNQKINTRLHTSYKMMDKKRKSRILDRFQTPEILFLFLRGRVFPLHQHP